MEIEIIDRQFTVCKVEDYSQVNLESDFCFIGKTEEERSLVCETKLVPANTIKREDNWKAFRIVGVLDFSMVGVLSEIAGILTQENISLFAVSTFNTDYILTKEEHFANAIQALEKKEYHTKTGKDEEP